MTIEELFSIQTDSNKLRSKYLELAKLEDFNPYRSNIISDMPKGQSEKNFLEWYTEEKERIESEIDFYKKKLQEDRKKIDDYIEQASYPECDIIRFRVINNLSWEEIGDYTGYSRRYVSKIFWEYVNKYDQNDQDDRTKV